jgi:hypothetical protein
LETRDTKHEPRSLTEQRTTWMSEASAVLGGSDAVATMAQTALAPPVETARIVDARWVAQTADHILSVMEASRSTWQMWHVRAEAQRQVRTTGVTAERASALVDLLVDEVLDRRSVALAASHDGIELPEILRRVDGSSVYTVAGAALYTSQRVLDAERRLLIAAGRHNGDLAAETEQHPLRHMLTTAAGRDLNTVGDTAAVLYWRLPELAPVDPGPLPWLPGIPETLLNHPGWGPYPAKRSQLVADLADRSKTTPAKVTPSQSGLHREVTRAPPSSAKSQSGGSPTASIPKTHDQPEEANSKRFRPCGNNASTGISRLPPTRQQMQGRRASGSTHRS